MRLAVGDLCSEFWLSSQHGNLIQEDFEQDEDKC